jgi:Fe-S-cluster containining protein
MSDPNACRRCGACCRSLIIEIDHIDVVREPRLLEHATLMDGGFQFENDWQKQYLLAAGHSMPCPMLGADGLCTIYPTRPNCCVAFEAGGEHCQDVRQEFDKLILKACGESL